MSGEQNDFISQVNQAHNASEQNYQEAYEQNAQIKHESAQATASRDEKLRRINSWREQYKSQLAPSPLEDITKLSAQLELTHAHPSGIAQLFASGKVTLQALFRDSGMLRAAGRRLDRVFEDRDNKAHENGVSELSLVVGVASWSGNHVPVLTYPVRVIRDSGKDETYATIYFSGNVRLNHALVLRLQERGVNLSEDALFDGANYESGTPETSAVFDAICSSARSVFPDFDIERDIVLGCFTDSGSRFLAESAQILQALKVGNVGNTMIDAVAGDERALKELAANDRQEYSPLDVDPHGEYEVGDVDNVVRYASGLAANGVSLALDVDAGSDSASIAAAISSRCVLAGKSILYVPNVMEQQRRFRHALSANEISSLALDVSDSHLAKHVDSQLIAAVGARQSVASSRFEQVCDELVGVKTRLNRYLGDLHGVDERWGVSAYQTMQNLAAIAMLPTHPCTHVRLDVAAARSLSGHLDEWAQKLHQADELGEFTIKPEDTPWFGASLFNENEAVAVYQRVVDVLLKLLPAAREHVKSTVQNCGFPVPATAREWGRQVTVLKNLRRVLDVFQADIFERDLSAMIEASKPKAVRKREGTVMGFWERRRHIKEARSLLRVGAKVDDLHEALKIVAQQAAQWRTFVPHGGWPVLPPKLDEIVSTQELLDRNLVALDAVLSTTRLGADLENVEFTKLDERLQALHDDRASLDTLPGRCVIERDLRGVGLEDLVCDLRRRNVTGSALDGELHLAWWTTVFEDIVNSSAIISNQDGSAMQDASDRFVQVDTEHVRSVGPMVQQETLKRLCELLFSRSQEANQLHTTLASNSSGVTFTKLMNSHADLLLAAKPIMVAMPSTLTMMTEFKPIVDIVILDSVEHLSNIELLSILARARQVVVIAHKNTVSSQSVNDLISVLPSVHVKSRATRRSLRLANFLENHGYGSLRHDVPVDRMQGKVKLHQVEASGVPVMSTGLIESSQREIDEVVSLIKQRATTFTVVPSSYVLAVVTLTSVFRNRLGAELKALAIKDENMNRFLRHVRLVDASESVGAAATDVILSLCYAKTSHGRLLQQFGVLEEEGGKGILLDSLALARRNLDIVCAFKSSDMEDERLHQDGPKLLKELLIWAEQLDDSPVNPTDFDEAKPEYDQDKAENKAEAADARAEAFDSSVDSFNNVLFTDLADRIRARGLCVAVNYGFDKEHSIPLVVGLPDKPFALAVLTDDMRFMNIESTRERHRMFAQDLEYLGWSVMNVWSVGAFVNPEKEVERVVSRIGELYGEDQ
ncbi:helicase [Gardnerella vaginalis]|uniref:helicase n=1 Tax=Gardnerella vaginalis TaxID=2702 RepID=UPI00254BC07C|nr:helicase [Gardnerella vaginalis]MDK7260121.1 helicase [Gardnerella vaginalis]MDK8776967.1 helicase [Gardnerella vaginalis]